MAAAAPTLEIDPDTELEFILSAAEATPTVNLTLRHAGGKASMAFKVKTTQPRRYLVRPNQGLIAPGGSEQVQILLVQKDKDTLLQSYERLGQTALDHCKDKFLVQSCAVGADFELEYAAACERDAALAYDKLSAVWAAVTADRAAAVTNKKLHVRHAARAGGAGPATPASLAAPKQPAKPVEAMDAAELRSEVSGLRRKNDELVDFSVSLTAERDILNNALEQTKRELNRELGKTAAQRNASNVAGGRVGGGADASAAGHSALMLVLVAVVMFVLGVRLEARGYVNALKQLPVLKALLGAGGGADEL